MVDIDLNVGDGGKGIVERKSDKRLGRTVEKEEVFSFIFLLRSLLINIFLFNVAMA